MAPSICVYTLTSRGYTLNTSNTAITTAITTHRYYSQYMLLLAVWQYLHRMYVCIIGKMYVCTSRCGYVYRGTLNEAYQVKDKGHIQY